ncbi:hypothetical protein JTE90_026466 [Oedothorax gibbosus]|uniref:RING-type domain-containing protein n=1 Tax=Oedothorax gibbosus TaxID=931172 RepID=A0AAV6VQT4_9ARAC|nr:hypothetical protein JTE90_026466 [Oedothorax gibbosus]
MESQSMDDSLCIIYESIIPPPKVEIVSEIERTCSEENVPRRRIQEVEIYMEFDQEPSQANALDDSVHILQENIPRQVATSSQNAENDDASSGVLAQAAARISQGNADDDLVRVLREKKIAEVRTFSQNGENDDAPSGNQKEVECAICLDSLEVILESNRKLGSTICGHIFCNMCMKIPRKKSIFCPSCRKPIAVTKEVTSRTSILKISMAKTPAEGKTDEA